MEAVEYIIRKGQRPQRTFFMAFGHDEEVSFNFMVISHCFMSEKEISKYWFNFPILFNNSYPENIPKPNYTLYYNGILRNKYSKEIYFF
jgi:hypothetical protein